MNVAILSGPTLTEFVEDSEAFNKCVDEQFAILDVDGDGVLSRSELEKEFGCLLSLRNNSEIEEEITSPYDTIFDKFDSDNNGTIDHEEFRSQMKEIMLAMARGLGDMPVQVALENDSFLMKALNVNLPKGDEKKDV